jgi:hypothetical protein
VTLIDCFWNVGISLAIVGLIIWSKVRVKVNYPISGLDRPLGLQDLRFPDFLYIRHMKFVSPPHWSPLPPGDISITFFFFFCQRLSRPQGHVAAGRIEHFSVARQMMDHSTAENVVVLCSLFLDFHICIVIVSTNLLCSGYCFPILDTGLQHWPPKQHHYH